MEKEAIVKSLSHDWSTVKEKYKLTAHLGQGASGEVVSGKNRETGEKVAIKLIKNVSKSVYSARKVLREIVLLRKLSECPNNMFTVKLIEIIFPKDWEQEPEDLSTDCSPVEVKR